MTEKHYIGNYTCIGIRDIDFSAIEWKGKMNAAWRDQQTGFHLSGTECVFVSVGKKPGKENARHIKVI